MTTGNKSAEAAKLTPQQRERIKAALYCLFVENRVSVVDFFDGELKPFEIWDYVFFRLGISKQQKKV